MTSTVLMVIAFGVRTSAFALAEFLPFTGET